MKRLDCWIIILLHLQSCMLLESCENRTFVYAEEGGNVNLPVQESEGEPTVDITWVTAGGNHFATTKLGQYLNVRDDAYKGRLLCSSDASLTIVNLRMEDEGIYRASIKGSEREICALIYNLTILAKLPDKSFVTDDNVSVPDVCVTCRINGSDVKFTCNQINKHHGLREQSCNCDSWNPDCNECVLQKFCKKDAYTDRIIPVVTLLPVLILLIIAIVVYILLRKHQKKKLNEKEFHRGETSGENLL